MNRFLMRLRGFLRKESLQIVRDPSSIVLALVMPLVLLVIFGYGVNLDAEHVPVAVVNDDPGAMSRDLVARFELSRNFHVYHARSLEQAREMIQTRDIDAIIRVQNDFSARLQGAASPPDQAPVQLIVNGIDANRARLIEGYVKNIAGTWAAARLAYGQTAVHPAVSIQQRIWFNEGAESRNFMIPGLITLIMTLIGILLTALVIAREW